jgi:hypothetical protein
MALLMLRAPSRRRDDVSISLRAPAGSTTIADLMRDVALGASCPPDKAMQVRSCILHSGRYDCRVATCAVSSRNLECMRQELARVGGSIHVLDDDGTPSLLN